MIVFRQRYPRWWFDFALKLARFGARVGAYVALLTDDYPSTVEEQSVHLQVDYPDAAHDLNRWLPLVKWLLAVPHLIVLSVLSVRPEERLRTWPRPGPRSAWPPAIAARGLMACPFPMDLPLYQWIFLDWACLVSRSSSPGG